MEIVISHRSDGKCEVRTSTGILQVCDNEHGAILYANGLKDGYRAAVTKLDTCHGWHYA